MKGYPANVQLPKLMQYSLAFQGPGVQGNELGIIRHRSFHGSGRKVHPASFCGDRLDSSVKVPFWPMRPAFIALALRATMPGRG